MNKLKALLKGRLIVVWFTVKLFSLTQQNTEGHNHFCCPASLMHTYVCVHSTKTSNCWRDQFLMNKGNPKSVGCT